MNRPLKTLLREYGIGIGAAIGAALLIRAFFFEVYRMPSTSMQPTIEPGDTLFVVKRFSDLRRGQVIVYENTSRGPQSTEHVRRIIGLPGERISLKEGRVHIDFKPKDITFPKADSACGTETLSTDLAHAVCLGAPTLPDLPEMIVPSDHYFVLVDHRVTPKGGRKPVEPWALVPRQNIVGIATRIWISGEYGHIRFERLLRRIE
jgi:signal peptidase I